MKKWIFGLGLFLIILAGYLFWDKKVEILSPLSGKKTVIQNKKNMKVVGFLPTWNIGKTIEYTDEISHLVFLGIEVDVMGNLIWDTQSKKINSEIYLKQKDLIWKNGGKNILGIKLFDDEKLDQLMKSEEAKENLINQLGEIIKGSSARGGQAKPEFDGINVDFEYQGSPVDVLSEEMVDFLNKLKQKDLGEISLDVFANTIIKGEQSNLNKLIEEIDYLIVMAYDFHRPGSDFVGPVAPIRAKVGERSILEVVEEIGNLGLDKNKIVLAYPLYGYEWKTYNNEFGAAAKSGWSALASYKRMKDFKNIKWDEESMTPWVTFEENGEIHQIYFENLESISRKIDLAKNNEMGGIGFWALGYEGENKDIWELK